VPLGETAHAVCVPLHRGRTTMVWQTTIMRADGKVAAIVTQTQMVLPANRPT
jgi:acyl-coenzyme A thioesterase PaaI-like protein